MKKKILLTIPVLLLLAVSAAHAQYEPNLADSLLKCSDTSGSSTAQSCTAPAGWTLPPLKGDVIVYYTTTTNTGALTLNFNGSGAAPVQKQGGIALAAGDIQANKPVLMTFDGTNWQNQRKSRDTKLLFAVQRPGAIRTSAQRQRRPVVIRPASERHVHSYSGTRFDTGRNRPL